MNDGQNALPQQKTGRSLGAGHANWQKSSKNSLQEDRHFAAAWDEEALRRSHEMDEDPSKSGSWDETMARLKSRFVA